MLKTLAEQAARPPEWAARVQGAIVLALAFLSPPVLRATTILPPRDLGELATGSEAAVLAQAGTSRPLSPGVVPWTAVRFLALEAISGALVPGDEFEVAVPGGAADGKTYCVAGSPRFREGANYVLFLARRPDGLWTPRLLAYGILEEREVGGRRLVSPIGESREVAVFLRPDGAWVEPPGIFDRDALIPHLRDVARGRSPWRSDLVRVSSAAIGTPGEIPEGGGAAVPEGCAYLTTAGMNFRWRIFDSAGILKIYATPGGDRAIPGGGFDLIQRALDIWTEIPGTSLNLLFGGTRDVAPICGGHPGFVLFEDPCSEIEDLQGCTGILAYGGGSTSGTHTFDRRRWATMDTWFVIVNNGVGRCLGGTYYTRMLAHELGHGLGFAHFADNRALMYEFCCNALSEIDRTCAAYTYPARDPANSRPRPDAGQDRKISLLGNSALLAGSAADDGKPSPQSLSWQWVSLRGPAGVAFGDSKALETSVTLPESGSYLFGLVANDGELASMDMVEIEAEVGGSSARTLAFQQNSGGYFGTVDTVLREASPSSSQPGSATLLVDADDPAGSGLSAVALIRFDGIFAPEPGTIAPGSVIRSAFLELSSTDAGDGAAIHRMRIPWDANASWASLGGAGIRPGVEASLEPDSIISAPGTGTVRIEVTDALNAWSRNPLSNYGWVLLPLGGDGWRIESAEGARPPRLSVEVSSFGSERLIARGDEWLYFKGKSAPPDSWREIDFTPSAAWLAGETGIGYGDGDDATVLSDMRGSYAAIFCRKEFVARSRPLELRFLIDYDDGFVAYLNGVEVARSSNLGSPGSAVAWNALASSDREAGVAEEYLLDPSALRLGKNVLAVEVHNASVNSSDLSFIPELVSISTVLQAGSEWSFLRGSRALPPKWQELGFDDSAWELGRTGIGYGGGDDITVLSDMRGNYTSVFLRKSFSVAAPEAIPSLLLQVLYDDGFVAYLNGVEVARANVPPGPASAGTRASSGIEPKIAAFYVPAALLRTGKNVLAASAHTASLSSSGLSFDAALGVGQATSGLAHEALFRRGDVSGDGECDVSDAVRLLLYLFRGGEKLDCEDAADFDDDGLLGLTDAIAILSFLFRGASAPAAPGMECGRDPTADALEPCSRPSC